MTVPSQKLELTNEGAKVSQWMFEKKLKLNADKTHLLTVERLRILPELPSGYMDGIQILESVEKSELLL